RRARAVISAVSALSLTIKIRSPPGGDCGSAVFSIAGYSVVTTVSSFRPVVPQRGSSTGALRASLVLVHDGKAHHRMNFPNLVQGVGSSAVWGGMHLGATGRASYVNGHGNAPVLGHVGISYYFPLSGGETTGRLGNLLTVPGSARTEKAVKMPRIS